MWSPIIPSSTASSLRSITHPTAVPAARQWSDGNEDFSLWHLPQVDWPVADRMVRVVKTVRVQKIKRVKIERIGELRDKKQEQISLQTTNLYASNVDLGSICPEFIHQVGRSRWTIDATAFQTLTTDCHLKQPSVHQEVALVVLTMIRVLAYTLTTVFYHRQVRSHCRKTPPSFCEAARSLALALLAADPDTS